MRFRHRRNWGKQNPRSTDEMISLIALCEGEKGVITNAFAGLGLTRRLAELGLTPGTEVKLIRKGSFHGPVEIEARGTTLALGYGVASKVFVRSSKAESNG